MEPVESSNGLEELNSRVVTAHKEVLAVVNNRAHGGITKRASPPAEMRLLFEQANPFASLGQRHTRREARETATDNQRVK
jgi:hypothetical protein